MTVGTDTWVTIAQADAYFLTRFGASWWAALTEVDKTALLVTAFNWLLYDAAFGLSPETDSQDVRVAQMESAYFIHDHQAEYEGRAANIAGGVTSVSASKWSESYTGSLKKPERVLAALQRAGVYNGSGGMIDLGENT
jgi:hypothetical protein